MPSDFETASLIPTFEVGDRVLVTPRPSEGFACPKCGRFYGDHLPSSFEATIIGSASGPGGYCVSCSWPSPPSEGKYLVRVPGRQPLSGVPWPWLTRIEAQP